MMIDTMILVADVVPNRMVIDQTQIIAAMVGVVLPILVGLVTKTVTRPAVKAMLLLLLSAVTGFLTEALNSDVFVWQQALFAWGITFVIGVAMHFGLWNPTGVATKAQMVGSGTTTTRQTPPPPQ
jgi:hypothetical protein